MKDLNAFADWILSNERHKIDKIMREVAKKIQGDMVGVTYRLIDMYYADYRPEVYIRTDDLSRPKQGKDGKFIKKTSNERKRLNSDDVSLKTAIKALSESKEPAIGVCKQLDGGVGYQAGVLFDPGYFEDKMHHSVMGKNFTEWDIAENFLFGQHGNGSARSAVTEFTEPHADMVLRDYLNSYKSRFDKHYQAAYKKYKNK